jgi:hypothetical protein
VYLTPVRCVQAKIIFFTYLANTFNYTWGTRPGCGNGHCDVASGHCRPLLRMQELLQLLVIDDLLLHDLEVTLPLDADGDAIELSQNPACYTTEGEIFIIDPPPWFLCAGGV